MTTHEQTHGDTNQIRIEEHEKQITLTRQMMYMSIGVSLLPLFLITAALLYFYHTGYTDKVVAHLKAYAQRHAQEVDNYLSERLANIKMLTYSHSLAELSDSRRLYASLKELQSAYPGAFNDLGLINAQGQLISYAGPYNLDKANYSGTDWFRQAIQTPEFISEVSLGLRRIPHFTITVRTTNLGEPWIIRATIDFAHFNALVKEIQIGKTGSAFIINKRGEFQTELRFGDTLNPHMIKTITSRSIKRDCADCYEYESPDGRRWVFVTAPLRNAEWTLVIQQEQSDAFKELYNAKLLAIIGIIFSSIVTIMTIVLLTRRIRQQLRTVEEDHESIQKQMVETGKLAAIGELAAGIAHEINNPVAIMVESAGWIQDLMKYEDFTSEKNLGEIHESLAEIVIQGGRCKEITHKLLSFARRTDSRVTEVDIEELLHEILALSSQKARFGNVTITEELEEGLPHILGSPTELQQVILNLINNAIDAIDKKQGKIHIRGRMEDEKLVLSIQDNGQGIPAANLSRIFEPFYTTKPVGKGTGLGLAICYGVVHKMGGDITVESEVNVGTTFHVHLPVVSPSE